MKKIKTASLILKNVVFLPRKTTKTNLLWLTKFLILAQLAVLALANARLELSPKATSTKSIPMNASNVALALALAPWVLLLWMNSPHA